MSVKLQQIQRNYRLRNHFGMRVTSLTPRSKLLKQGQKRKTLNQPSVYCFIKSWHRLWIKEMIKWRRFCRILKRLNVINVNSEYCVKRVNFLSFLRYICSAQSENLDNSGIALRKVRIPKLADRVRILTLRGTIPELSVRKVRIGTK